MTEHQPWERIGSSDTAVLLVHGILGTPRHFDFLKDSFPADWTLRSILLDGHGDSVKTFAHTSSQKWIDQMNRELEALCKQYRRVFIVAHSLGTLLSLEVHERFREQIAGMLLLAVPLHIRLKPHTTLYSLQVIFRCVNENDPLAVSYRRSYGIEPDIRLWRYLSWIPRYLDLFALSRRVRRNIRNTVVPCIAFHSEKDEMVSPRSVKKLKTSDHIRVEYLQGAGHHHYPEQAAARLRAAVAALEEELS